jgi:hypothetical protein
MHVTFVVFFLRRPFGLGFWVCASTCTHRQAISATRNFRSPQRLVLCYGITYAVDSAFYYTALMHIEDGEFLLLAVAVGP